MVGQLFENPYVSYDKMLVILDLISETLISLHSNKSWVCLSGSFFFLVTVERLIMLSHNGG